MIGSCCQDNCDRIKTAARARSSFRPPNIRNEGDSKVPDTFIPFTFIPFLTPLFPFFSALGKIAWHSQIDIVNDFSSPDGESGKWIRNTAPGTVNDIGLGAIDVNNAAP